MKLIPMPEPEDDVELISGERRVVLAGDDADVQKWPIFDYKLLDWQVHFKATNGETDFANVRWDGNGWKEIEEEDDDG